MSNSETHNFFNTLTSEETSEQPAALPTGIKFESDIGHTQSFCPTAGVPDQSQIWIEFEKFQNSLTWTNPTLLTSSSIKLS